MRVAKYFAIIGAISVLTACSAPGTPVESASPTPEKVYVTAPLTGVKYEDTSPQAAILKQPSVACKIDNGSEAPRPQAGLNSTDIVFDEMVEGGLTRLVAIWHSAKPDAIGPVRSIRPMDPDIISAFGGIVCYSGGQWAFVKAMQATPVFNASETSEQGNDTFSRSKDRIAPHNVIVNVSKLASDHPELTPPTPQFLFASTAAGATAVMAASPIKSVDIKFPSADALWKPNADGSAWLRTQDGAPLTDKLDGEQIHATNIVVLENKIDRSYLDKRYGNVPKTVMVASGKAWVFTGGSYVQCTWSKASATSPIMLTDSVGSPVLLAPGNTWVELMPLAPEGRMTIVPVPVTKDSPSPTSSK